MKKKNNLKSGISHSPLQLRQEDLAKLEQARELILSIKEKYHLDFDDLKPMLEKELSFPDTILNKKLTILESITKYLKEEKNLSLKKISEILNRDQRNIWHIYKRSTKKHPKRFIIKKPKFWIPLSIFSLKLSAQESIVAYLKDELSLSYHQIALLLKRDDRTVWTVYQRARKKNVKPR